MQMETLRMRFRPLEESDYSLYSELAREHRLFRRFFAMSPEETKNSYWKMVTAEGVEYFTIFSKGNDMHEDEFCGSMYLRKRENSDVLQFGIDFLGRFQGRGMGPEAVRAFQEYLLVERDINQLYLEISTDNSHSKSMFEKLGAKEHQLDMDDSMALRQMIIDAAGQTGSKNIKKYDLIW